MAFVPLVQTADTGADWARRLDRHGDTPALITADGTVTSYAALLAMADAFAATVAPAGARRFIVLMVRNEVASLAAYLGCLRGGHPVLLFDAEADAARIRSDFAPDVVAWPGDGRIETALTPDPAVLHPDLALLLSTSGSTGSPKLVRLSAAAMAANAAAIIAYLGIDASDRALMTLPMHYSFGLSVVNSHLMAGAALIVTDLSVTHPDFASLLTARSPTSLSGVPYLFDLLESTGLAARLPPSLRTLAQAGGRMPPDKVIAWTARGAAAGFRFVAMYGQTEAGPRMAWLPPELATAHPDCIGRPIPGGSFRLVDDTGAPIDAAETPGELVYSGPNVMMGYAFGRADLALGQGPAALHTGDIAVRNNAGLYRITGRASRFAKIAGLRIGFDDLEARLAEAGVTALVSGDDRLISVNVRQGDADRIVDLVSRIAQVPASAVVMVSGIFPRLATGKPDYTAIRRSGEQVAAARSERAAEGVHPILAGYRLAFNRDSVTAADSFASLGGDSLVHVNIAMIVERALGRLPTRWEAAPISSLVAEAQMFTGPATRSGWRTIGSETLLRLLALVLVVAGHAAPADTLYLRGGATILFCLAGYNLARFQRGAFEAGQTLPALRGALERMILPYYAVMLVLLLASHATRHWGWFALVSVFTVSDFERGPLFALWFIESVFHALLITILLFQLPAVQRLSRTSPFGLGLLLLAIGLALRILVPAYLFDDVNPNSLTVDAHYYLYALGWLALVAQGRGEQLLVFGLALALSMLDYGLGSSRPAWLAMAVAVLFLLPTVRVPEGLALPLLRMASAGYFIYIAHVVVIHVLKYVLHMPNDPVIAVPAVLLASTAAGLVFERAWLAGFGRVTRALRQGS